MRFNGGNKNGKKAHKSTSNHVTATKGSVLFNTGTSLQFAVVKDKIIGQFKQEGVYDTHIRFDPNLDANEIVETTFDDLEPTQADEVDNVITERLAAVHTKYDNRDRTTMNDRTLSIRRIIEELEKLGNQRQEAVTEVNSKRYELVQKYKASLKIWKDDREKFRAEKAKCMKVFNLYFGDLARGVVKQFLDNDQYRAAWYHICKLYGSTAANKANAQQIITYITTKVYDASNSTLEDLEQELSTLYQQLVAAGENVSESLKLQFLCGALERSPGEEFKSQIEAIQNNSHDYEEGLALLHKQAAKLGIGRELDKRSNANQIVVASLKAITPGPSRATLPTCSFCHKVGHKTANCWEKMTCYKCGEKGHIAPNCRNKRKKDDTGTEEEQDSKSAKVKVTHASRFPPSNPKKNGDYFKSSVLNKLFSESVPEVLMKTDIHTQCDCTSPYLYAKVDNITTFERMADHHLSSALSKELLSLFRDTLDNTWRIIIDSGATAHMLPYQQLICKLRSAQGRVFLGDESHSLSIEGCGDTRIPQICNVLYVPNLKVGVISVPCLDEGGYKTKFGNGVGIVQNRDGDVIMTATLVKKLYCVDAFFVRKLLGKSRNTLHYTCTTASYDVSEGIELEQCNITMEVSCAREAPTTDGLHDEVNLGEDYGPGAQISECDGNIDGARDISRLAPCGENHSEIVLMPNPDKSRNQGDHLMGEHMNIIIDLNHALHTMSTEYGLNPLEVLHRQWGHLGEANIKRALKNKMVKGCKYTYEDVKDLEMRVCYDCLRGRMKARPSNPVTDHDWAPLQKIAIDFKGYFKKRSHRGYKGFMLLVDYNTNYLYADLVKKKSEHVRVLADFMRKVVKPSGKIWDTLQSDAESIFNCAAVNNWLRKHDIKSQFSVPYQHWQNGQVEVYIGIVMDKCRILMCSYNVPGKYWEYAVMTAVFLINRSPTSGRELSSYEELTGEKPDVSKYVPFYAPGVFHLTADERKGNPLTPKAEPCRMLGYADEYCNAYYVLNVRTQRVVVRENCIFSTGLRAEDIADADADIDRDDDELAYEETEEAPNDDDTVSSEESSELKDLLVPDDSVEDDEDAGEALRFAEFIPDPEEDQPEFSNSQRSAILSDLRQWYSECIHVVHKVLALPPNPKSIDDALNGPDGQKWYEAIVKEIDQFRVRNLWKSAKQEGRAMKTKMILIYKYDAEFNIVCKARLVVCGYSQVKGIDYHETFAPTTTNPIVFLLLHIAAIANLHVYSFDVSAAFLEGKPEDVKLFAWLPAELSSERKAERVEIDGNWYGEKQAGNVWNKLFHSIIISMGYEQCDMMQCLYRKIVDDDYVFITIHVDDGLLVTTDHALAKQFIDDLMKSVRKAVINSEVKLFLGMDIVHKVDRGMSFYTVSQERYIKDNFDQWHHVVRTPMSTTSNLRVAVPNSNNESLLPFTGKLRFLADRTRPDILVALGEVSTGGANEPSDEHVSVCKRIMNYLTSTKSMEMRLGGEGPVELFGYCDAAYITDGKARSRLAGCLFAGLYAGAIHSFSRNDNTVSHSSTEPEIKAIDLLCREIVYYRRVKKFLGYEPTKPTRIYVDSRSAIEICKTLKTNSRVRHINMRIHFIRELINARVIELYFVPGRVNVSDALTKPLQRDLFERHIGIILHGHNGILPEDMHMHSMTQVLSMIDNNVDFECI